MFYSQLNTFSAYEFGESTIMAKEYAERAKELGYSAIAFNDSVCYGYPELADACEGVGIKPVFGYRIRISTGMARPLDASLFILNEEGYHNLCLLLSEKPLEEKEKTILVGMELLSRYHQGLALVIDCSGTDFYDDTFLTVISPDLMAYHSLFQDDFYLGISVYSQQDMEDVKALYSYADQNEYHSLAYPKAVYLKKTDAKKTFLLQESMRRKTEKKEEKEEPISLPEGGPYFLLSEKALVSLYRDKEILESKKLTDKITFRFFHKRGGLIQIENADLKLQQLALKGLNAKMNPVPQEYLNRLAYELGVIKEMHFSSYFLIVVDYVSFARHAGIKIGPGRGSAGGALVTYCLGITSIDPIRYHLSFERFLNPMRKNMPDIDIDFEGDRRNEVVTYLKQHYGESRVADIVSYTMLKPRSALILIAPVLGLEDSKLKNLTKNIDASVDTFEDALNPEKNGYSRAKRFRSFYADPYYQSICEKASWLCHLPINTGLHASGIIVSEKDLYGSVPMRNGKTGTVLFEYSVMERLGFLKLDILSLPYLTFLKNIEERILKHGKEIPDVEKDLQDQETYAVLNRGDVASIFQLVNPGMREAALILKPTCFDDLCALIALYRPGPKQFIPSYARRKEGKEKVVYDHPLLEPILKDTYGIMIYQEQVMEAVKVLAGFSLGEADMFRRAISKKDVSQMEKYKSSFLAGCKKNGIEESKALEIFSHIESFADYGFNKSHAYSYGLLVYRFLYYKTHFPEEFYQTALLLKSLKDDSTLKLLHELKERKIRLLPPDINASEGREILFAENKALLPLRSVKGMDDAFLDKLLAAREKGPFVSFYDFIQRICQDVTDREKPILESLIEAGAFDSLTSNRRALVNHLTDYLEFARLSFQNDNVPDFSKEKEDIGERLFLEKNSLGLILSTTLAKVVYKKGFTTMIASDTSNLEMHHSFLAETEGKQYHINLAKKVEIPKYAFLLVEGNLTKPWLDEPEIILVGRKEK